MPSRRCLSTLLLTCMLAGGCWYPRDMSGWGYVHRQGGPEQIVDWAERRRDCRSVDHAILALGDLGRGHRGGYYRGGIDAARQEGVAAAMVRLHWRLVRNEPPLNCDPRTLIVRVYRGLGAIGEAGAPGVEEALLQIEPGRDDSELWDEWVSNLREAQVPWDGGADAIARWAEQRSDCVSLEHAISALGGLGAGYSRRLGGQTPDPSRQEGVAAALVRVHGRLVRTDPPLDCDPRPLIVEVYRTLYWSSRSGAPGAGDAMQKIEPDSADAELWKEWSNNLPRPCTPPLDVTPAD